MSEEISERKNYLARLRRLTKNPLVQKICLNCGKPFETRTVSLKKYCSKECVTITYHDMKKLERRARGLKPRGKPSKIKREPKPKPEPEEIRKLVNLNIDSIIEIPCLCCLSNNKEKESKWQCEPNSCELLTEWLEANKND